MREVSIKVYDDLDFRRDGTKNEAAVTVTLGFQGKWVELDLSERNNEELHRAMGVFMDAGHPPEHDQAPAPPKGTISRKSPEFEYGKALRAFAKEQDIPYRTKTGKYYYSRKLTGAFEKHLADTGNTQLSETYREHLASRGQTGSMS